MSEVKSDVIQDGDGTLARPIMLMESMGLARAFLRSEMATENGRVGLWCWRDEFWVWYKGRWVKRGRQALTDHVFRWGENVHCWVPVGGGMSAKRWSPTKNKCEDVVAAIAALRTGNWVNAPAWTEEAEQRFNPEHCVGFEDVVLSVETGEVRTVVRDETWFDPGVMPCAYEEGAQCPRWMKCLNEWATEPEWKVLDQRIFGAAITGNRRHAKIPLLFGATRGGKGVNVRMIQMLLGDVCFMSSTMSSLTDTFGLDGCEFARVLSISELVGQDWVSNQKFTGIVKNIVGRDSFPVNIKYQRQVKNVTCGAMVVLSSNRIPTMANDGDSMGSKMVILPFVKSFREKPELDLEDKLKKEAAGIAAWAVRGACDLQKGLGWPELKSAKEIADTYRALNNPYDQFLQARFEKKDDGFVTNETLWDTWQEYRRVNKIKDDVPRNMLPVTLVTETSWSLKKNRVRVEGGQVRGLVGLGLLKQGED